MAQAKKTFKVAEYFDMMQLALDLSTSDDERKAFCYAIERLLFETNNYHGFQHFNAQSDWTTDEIMIGEANYYRRRYYRPQA